jgi:cerevisin
MKFSTLATLPLLSLLAHCLVIPHDGNTVAAFREGELSIKPVENGPAPLVTSENAKAKQIDDSYIIVFKEHVDGDKEHHHHNWLQTIHDESLALLQKRDSQHPFLTSGLLSGLKDTFNIGEQFKGYSGRFHQDVVEMIRHHPDVAYIEHDSMVHANEFEVEKDAPWGLARVSHREPLSLGSFNKYLYDDEGGEGVTAYVIDTGTNYEHEDFEGRASWGKTIPDGDPDEDGNGHGTHCSGTIAGKKYGIAKKANVVAVKVLRSNGSGSMSDVIKGVEWAVGAHLKDAKSKKKGYKGATANMSLGGGKSPSLDVAVNAAVKAGVHFAVAAGNDNADACDYSPAAAENAVTVGATALSDDRAYFSNYGKCVDIFGPGVNILSTYMGSKHAVATLSGTSMASPHICGLLTYYLSLQPATDSEFAVKGSVTPAQLKKNLISFGTKDVISGLDEESPNVLAYNGGGHNISSFWENGSADEDQQKNHHIDIVAPIDEIVQGALDEIDSAVEQVKQGLGF